MRRLTTAVLLLACACTLLVLQGSDSGVRKQEDSAGRQGVARNDKQKNATTGKPFRLPDDETGALLGQVLPPQQTRGPLHNPRREVRRTPPAPDFAVPDVTLPGADHTMPRLPAPAPTHTIRPHLLDAEQVGETPAFPTLPDRPTFILRDRVRTPSPDVNLPPPLPLLALFVPDRAPLDDATAEASAAAVLTAPLPRRTTPAPYERVRVPDPFENHRPLLVPLPAEKATPVTATPTPPKP